MAGSTDTGAPLPLPDELARPRLVAQLARRWDHAVTLVVGGAGFGKSTAVAQAVRSNALNPRGFDRWVSCGPGHEQAEHLAGAILAAFGRSPQVAEPLAQVVDAIDVESPVDVSLVLDDVHMVPEGSSSAALLDDLLRRLPAHAHLVFVGRSPPPVPLARLRAAGDVVEIAEEELAFTPAEAQDLAGVLGRRPMADAAHGGWPALVRLALAADRDVALDYVHEEVLAGLTVEQRNALFALASIGCGTEQTIAEITGGPVDLAALATRIPLISRDEAGRYRTHDLWLDALSRQLTPAEARTLRVRAIERMTCDGELARAGALAIAAADWDSLARVTLELLSTTVSALPLDIATGWRASLPAERRGDPAFALLDAAITAAEDFTDTSVDTQIDAVAERFQEAGEPLGAVVALAIGTVVAQSRGDAARLVELAERMVAVEGADDHPIVRLATHAVAAVVAEMGGDPDTALEEFAAAPLDEVPPAIGLSAFRFFWHCLLLAGRADEAATLAERRLAPAFGGGWRPVAVARWMAGDPSGFLSDRGVRHLTRTQDSEPGPSSRDAFVRAALTTVVSASLGERPEGGITGGWLAPRAALPSNARDAALVTNAMAATAVLDHDEEAASTAFDCFLDLHPASEAFGERHLRRFLALGYVLDDRLRARWEAADLGPSHQLVRTAARALLAARRGQPLTRNLLTPPQVVTALPLPWSIELACRARSHGDAWGFTLAEWLVDNIGPAARRELRRVANEGGELEAAATALLGALPVEPATPLRVDVLGSLQVYTADDRTPRAELRRIRVRELLAVLVVEQRVSRDRMADLIWGDHHASAAARNLRVTLSYVRRLLEPDRPPGEASFHLRADTSHISLFRSDHLVVDAWELERSVAEARAARVGSDVTATIEILERATSLWRGAPLVDLERFDDLAGHAGRLRHLQVGALLDLGELQLARGRAHEALANAERALGLDPYGEQAHRLAVAAALQLRDADGVRATTERTKAVLREIGAEPEPTTAILLQRSATWMQTRI